MESPKTVATHHSNAQGNPANASMAPSSFVRHLAVTFTLFNMLLTALVSLTLYRDYGRSESDASITTRNVSLTLAQSLSGAIREVELGLLAVGNEYERQLAAGLLDEAKLNAFIAREHGYLPQIDSLRIADGSGHITYGIRVDRHAKVSISDRDYFAELRNNPLATLVFSKPVLGRISKKWVLIISRRLNHPNGTFAGVVYAPILIQSIQRQFKAINLGKHGLLALRNDKFELVVQYPALGTPEETLGNRQPSHDWDLISATDLHEKTFFSTAGTDDIPRMVTFRRVEPYPLCLLVGVARDAYLASWWREGAELLGFLFLSLSATGASAIAIYRSRRREQEAARDLAAQQEKYRVVADNTLDWEFWIAPSGSFVYCSPSCLERTGYEAAEFYQNPKLFLEIVHMDDRASFQRHFEAQLRGDAASCVGQFRIIRKDGTIRWVEHTCRLVTDNNDRFLGIRGNHRDVTERRKAEQERRYLFDIIERSLNEIYVFDPITLRFKHVNHGALVNLQYSLEQIVKLSPVDIKPSQTEKSFRELLQPLLNRTQETLVFETIHQRADRSTYPVEVHLQLMNTGDEDVFLAVIFDISERQKAEKAKNEAIARVWTLEGIIPICMYCKRIRESQSTWSQIERYITEHSEAKFSHGICPKCLEERKDEFGNP